MSNKSDKNSNKDILIAFDTSTDSMALGAAFDGDPFELRNNDTDFGTDFAANLDEMILYSGSIPSRRCANTNLLPSLNKVFEDKGICKEDIAAVICGRGPGSFTGVRIGIATAKGIACALPCALFGVSTLDAIAWEVWLAGYRGVLGVVGDALRKEVFPVKFTLDQNGITRLDPDQVDKPANVGSIWANWYSSEHKSLCVRPNYCDVEHDIEQEAKRPMLLAGDGLLKFQDVFSQSFDKAGVSYEILPKELWAVTGRGLLMTYFDLKEKERLSSGHPQELLPVYTRLSDAEENEKILMAKNGTHVKGVLVGNPEFDIRASFDKELHPENSVNLLTNADAFGASTSEDVPKNGVGHGVGYGAGNEVENGLENGFGKDARIHYKYEEISKIDNSREVSREHKDEELSKKKPLILAIETSCDETAVAVIDGDKHVISDLIATQIDFHARFGGVVPEIASRKHTEAIVGVLEETMDRAGLSLGLGRALNFDDIDAIAVTQGPGLVGALVVGVAFAKGLSWSSDTALIGVNHLEGHIYANQIANPDIRPPMVVCLVSGGHTMLVHVKDWGDYEILGQTLDDAVGEAFDKVAKALGLGYPGGPVISKLASQGDPNAIDFPRAMLHSHDFSFSLSGLKTAVMTYIKDKLATGDELNIPDIAASFQRAVVDVQVAKALAAIEQTDVDEFCLGGGVAANSELRTMLKEAIEAHGVRVTLPELSACTDNAAMIAVVASDMYKRGKFLELDADCLPNMEL